MEKLRVSKVYSTNVDKQGNPLSGKYGPYWRVGLKTDRYGDEWVSGFSKFNCKDWEGKEIELEIYEEVYNGKICKKFKIPNKGAQLEERVKTLEEKVERLLATREEPVNEPVKGPDGEDIPF